MVVLEVDNTVKHGNSCGRIMEAVGAGYCGAEVQRL